MPKTKISEYSTTNSDNTDIESINIAEGCAPSGINNAIRELMVHLKEFQTGASGDAFTFAGGVLISGTANTITGNVLMSGTNTITGSTTATFAAGAVGTPSIAAHGDTNTGIFFPAADTIAFAEGGAEAMRIDSDGDVGIGTTSPSSKLHVVGSSLTNTLRITDGTNYTICAGYLGSGNVGLISTLGGSASLAFGTDSTERMRIDSSGNVGIGTSSPNSYSGYTTLTLNNASTGSVVDLNVNGTRTGSLIATSNFVTLAGITASSQVVFESGGTERARITSGGAFLFGATTTGSDTAGIKLQPVGTYTGTPRFDIVGASTSANDTIMQAYSTGAGAYRFYVQWNGQIYATNTTITGISDARLKENIRDLDDGLNSILALKPRKFDWKEGKGKDIKDDRGFVAQEFEEVFPDLIDEWKDPAPEGEGPYKSVRADLIPVLVKAIQELKAITDAQATRIEALEAEVAAMKAGNGN